MKIAVTTQEGQIFQHFGKCPTFTVFTVDDGKITDKTLLDATGHGHAALSGFLKEAGTDVVICGGLGEGARNMLRAAGIRLISGAEGSVDEAAAAFLAGELTDQGGNCSHEAHPQGHTCDCGNHTR